MAGIVAEGIDLAKFDALPVVSAGRGRWCVGGDGHSVFEALRRLARDGRLPEAWKRGKGWDVPVRMVSPEEAQRLAWTANLSRDNFSAVEEAKGFRAMVEAGMGEEEMARVVQRSDVYVRKTLALNVLCRDIRDAVGLAPDAGGIDKYMSQAMAEKFDQYRIGDQQQQELWHRVFEARKPHREICAGADRQGGRGFDGEGVGRASL
jgi:ParB-like chromosome segregation protein Spo0J